MRVSRSCGADPELPSASGDAPILPENKVFPRGPCALLVRTAAVGVASWAILPAQTLLHTRSLSGSATDTPTAIATDSQGNVYIAGATTSPDFPLTQALFARLPEPALRVSTDGRTFAPATLSVPEVNTVAAASDGSVVLAGTNAGLYRSPDGGATWAPSASLPGQIAALAADPLNSGIAYAVVLTSTTVMEFVGPVTNWTWTIYKSTDSGVTWKSSAAYTLSPVTAAVSRIFVNPLNPSIVYAFVNSALMRSTDAGATWQQLTIPAAQANLGQTNPTAFAIAPSQPNIAYATTYYFPMMKSFDGGVTWQPAASIGSAGENAIAVDPQDASVVWLVDGAGIHKSTDGAATFQRVAAMGDGSWRSIAVSNTNSSEVFATDLHNVYATNDGGSTWTTVASGQLNAVFVLGSRTLPGRVRFAHRVSDQARPHPDADRLLHLHRPRQRLPHRRRSGRQRLPGGHHAVPLVPHHSRRFGPRFRLRLRRVRQQAPRRWRRAALFHPARRRPAQRHGHRRGGQRGHRRLHGRLDPHDSECRSARRARPVHQESRPPARRYKPSPTPSPPS